MKRFISLLLACLLLSSCSVQITPKEVADTTADLINTEEAVPPETAETIASQMSVQPFVPKLNTDALVTISAAKSINGVIPCDTVFNVATSDDFDAERLSSYISVTPSLPFSITGSGTDFTLTPAAKLDENTVYRFTVGEKFVESSFAFQTESALVIKSVFPADLSTDVPVNTGIEVAFSEPVTVDAPSMGAFVSVEPVIDVEFMLYPDCKTLAVVPAEKLTENTVYTVTVKKGITGASGKSLAEDKAFAFRTADFISTGAYPDWGINLSDSEIVVPIGQKPHVGYYFNTSNTAKQGDAEVNIYKYASVADAINAIKGFEAVKGDYANKTYLYPSDGLTNVASLSVTPESPDDAYFYSQCYLNLPLLDPGVYLCEYVFNAEIAGKAVKSEVTQQLISVTNIRTYHESYGGSAVLWLNEYGGGSISDAAVSCDAFTTNDGWSTPISNSAYSHSEYKTDTDGIALLDLNDANAALLLIESEEDSRYLCISADEYDGGPSYFAYINTDRSVYFSDDTVKLHGVCAPKRSDMKLPESVMISTSYSNSSVTIPLSDKGSFDYEFNIEQYSRYGISIDISDPDGNHIISSYITVTQDEKPLYTASLDFDHVFYERGDTVTATITANYFDGTPAPNLTFEFYDELFGNQKTLTTDDDGKASISFIADKPSYNCYSTAPISIYASAHLTGLENTSIYLSASAAYFHCPVRFNAFSEGESNEHTIVTLNSFDTSKITSQSDAYNEDVTIGEPVSGSVHVSAMSYEYVKVVTGNEYNPITKLTEEKYYYDTNIKTFESYDAAVENGRLVLDNFERPEGFDGYYQYCIVYTDPYTGNHFESNVYAVKGESGYYHYDGNSYYSLRIEDSLMNVGNEVKYSYTNGEDVKKGAILYLVYSTSDSRLDEYGVTKDGEFNFIYKEDFIAGCYVSAARFNGEAVEMLYAATPSFNSSDRQLAIGISCDKESYRPGDRANISFNVTDINGNPVSGSIAVAIVDEACFALGEQNINPMSFYGSYTNFYPSRNSKLSCIGSFAAIGLYKGSGRADLTFAEEAEMPVMMANGDATAGMGGGEQTSINIREIFSDNPYFGNVPIEDGSAVLVFDTPDNITEWRVTAVAEDLNPQNRLYSRFGFATSGIITTLPMFINAQITSSFVAGDDVSATVKLAGTNVKSEDSVVYSAKLFDDEDVLQNSLEVTLTASETVIFNFGKCEVGSYKLTVTAVSGEYSDGVTMPFDVLDSGIVMNIVKTLTADEIKDISPALYPVTLSFANGAYGDYLRVANRLMYYKTQRSDSLASYYAAITANSLLFGDNAWYADELAVIKKNLSSHDGLIPLIDYGEGSIELSAKIAAVVPEALNDSAKSALREAFNSIISERSYIDDIELAATYLGLSALGEPVLADLNYAYGYMNTIEAKLYMSAAFAALGDYSSAYSIYSEAVSIAVDHDEAYIDGSTPEESVKLTALALLTAVHCDKQNAEAMTRYLISHTSTIDIYTLEMAAYLRHFYPLDAEKAAFTYTIGDKTENVELGAGEVKTISLNKAEFEAFSLTNSSGELLIRTFYRGGIKEAANGVENDDSISVTKTIAPHDKERGLYRVTLSYSITFDRDFASFTLNDRIPSGARYFGACQENAGGQSDWDGHHFANISNNNQTMSGYVMVWNGSDYGNMINGIETRTVKGSVSYIIRAATEGEFVSDSAVIQNSTTGGWAQSDRAMVTISADEWTIK